MMMKVVAPSVSGWVSTLVIGLGAGMLLQCTSQPAQVSASASAAASAAPPPSAPVATVSAAPAADVPAPAWEKVTTTGAAPSPRCASAGAVVGDRLYVFGGVIDSAFHVTNDLWAYDVSKNQWAKLEPAGEAPPARQITLLAADEARAKLYLYGGERLDK